MAPNDVQSCLLSGFDDPTVTLADWDAALRLGPSNTVFQTRQWLQAWWETLGSGQLLLVAARRGGRVVAIAPLYESEGMLYFLGAGESDFIDFVGAAHDDEVLTSLLATARAAATEFLGFKLHEIPDRTGTAETLRRVAPRLGLDCFDEGELPSVEIDLATQSEEIRAAVSRSMLKREEYCRRHGELEILRLRQLTEIRPHLAEYYAQHLQRWEKKGLPSPYSEPQRRAFLERFLELAEETGWIRFLRINWNGHPLAFEFAWYYEGVHYSAPWCFAVEFANQSPGHILLRQSVLSALDENLRTYDLGAGDQEYKFRLPSRAYPLHTWGLYPR